MNGKKTSRETLILDIEDLKRQMAALQESEGKYRQWFQDAPISLWEEDFSEVKLRIDDIKRRYAGDLEAYFHAHPDLVRELADLVRVVDVNEATLRLYKAKTREDFVSGITRVFSTESYEMFIPVLMTVGEGGTRLFAEKTHLALDGEIIYIQLHWIVPPGYEHTYGRVLVSIIDISARKRMEMALRESEEKYRLITDNMADTVWVMDMNMRFTYVSPSVTRMYGTTVEEVMNQPIARSLTPESLETAMRVFSEEMAREARGTTEQGRIVLQTDIPLRRRFPVDWHPECEAYACMEVRDDGPGIIDQEMENLFDPFFSTKLAGRGLGLSIALGIVRAHGGCITVESRCRAGRVLNAERGAGSGEQGAESDSNTERGAGSGEEKKETIAMRSAPCALRQDSGGSVFRVFLPLSEETVARPAQKAVQVSGPKRSGTVLLVEDANQVRRLEVQMLELLGWKVLEANDGVEGVEIFREHSKDIRFVLCDLSMPRLDGWQTLAAMRGIRPDIPVILASGYDEASVMAGNQVERPQVFLGKPYGFEELREAIGRTLEPGMNRDAGSGVKDRTVSEHPREPQTRNREPRC